MTFLPSYRSQPTINIDDIRSIGNMGLYFNKFADAWQWKKGFPAFDPPPDRVEPGYRSWLARLAAGAVGNDKAISEASARLLDLILQCDGAVLGLQNESRFVSGTGLQHPTENGFAWHPTLGVPYLPSTGVKGTFASYVYECEGPEIDQELLNLSGECGSVGTVQFTDMIPLGPVKLAVEVMTPHYGEYYQKGKTPGDWMSPVPITYLAVEKNQKWICGIIPVQGVRNRHRIEEAATILSDAFRDNGAGAKTEVGFGRFKSDESILAGLTSRRIARMELQAAEASRKQAMQNSSPQLASLMQRYHSDNWSKDIQIAKKGLEGFLMELQSTQTKLEEDSSQWIRKSIIETGKNAGAWDNPRATKGRNQKLKYSKTIVELVERIKGFNQTAP